MDAQYWVAKADPKQNSPEKWRRGVTHLWWSHRRTDVRRGDRALLWLSSPSRQIVGLAEVVGEAPTWNSRKRYWQYSLRYVSGGLKHPLGITECRQLPPLASASFLKPAVMGTFHQLDREQAVVLFAALCAKNRGLGQHWTELRSSRSAVSVQDVRGIAAAAPFTQKQYLRAFRLLEGEMHDGQRQMLMAHARAPGRYMDVEELARSAGQGSPNYTYSQYGHLGHLIAKVLGSRKRLPVWTRVLGDDVRDPKSNRVGWTLHREVGSALEQVNWKPMREAPDPVEDVARDIQKLMGIKKTTREQLVLARLGQGEFRQALISYWGGCAVTGCRVLDVVRASHIKPWRDSSRKERLSLDNGLLLTAHLDALFDAGLITFSDNGALRITARLGIGERRQLGLRSGMRLRHLTSGHRIFLRWHRDKVFSAK